MQTVAHLDSVTLHPSHHSKYVRLRLANGVLFIEGSIDDDKNSWSDLIEKRQLFDEPVAGLILHDIRRSRKEASSKFEKAALKEIERMFIIMRGQNAMKTKKPKYVSKRPKLITVDDTYGHATPPKPKFFVGQTVYFTWKHKPEDRPGFTFYSTETAKVVQILDDHFKGFTYSLVWRCAGLKALFEERELSASQFRAKEVFIPEARMPDPYSEWKEVKFTAKSENTGEPVNGGEIRPVMIRNDAGELVEANCLMLKPGKRYLFDTETGEVYSGKLYNVKTQELMTELKRRGLGVFSLDMPFQYIPKRDEKVLIYKLREGKKLKSINVLYGRPPENYTDLTKLTFMKADFDPSRLNDNEGYFKCLQFEWVFIADLDEFTPFTDTKDV